MAKYYVANENGDWWTMEGGEVLYVIGERTLSDLVLIEDTDKLDRYIKQYGKKAIPMVDAKELI